MKKNISFIGRIYTNALEDTLDRVLKPQKFNLFEMYEICPGHDEEEEQEIIKEVSLGRYIIDRIVYGKLVNKIGGYFHGKRN